MAILYIQDGRQRPYCVFTEPQIAPFDPPTPKTLAWNETWSGSDVPFPRYSRILVENRYPLVFGAPVPVWGEAVRFTQQLLVTKN